MRDWREDEEGCELDMDTNSLRDMVGENQASGSVLDKSDPGVSWTPLRFRVRVNWCVGVRVELSRGLS